MSLYELEMKWNALGWGFENQDNPFKIVKQISYYYTHCISIQNDLSSIEISEEATYTKQQYCPVELKFEELELLYETIKLIKEKKLCV